MKNLFIILPAYNESENIPDLLKEIDIFIQHYSMLYDYKIVFVDDGSSDDTLDTAKKLKDEFPLEIITHEHNRGLGEALKSGFSYCVNTAHKDDIIITMDTDNTHPPALIHSMIQKILEGADIVIASRYQNYAKVLGLTRFRKFLSRIASFMSRAIFRIPGIKDYTCGYRAYRASLIIELFNKIGVKNFIEEMGFVCQQEILIKLKKHTPHMIAVEVPLILHYEYKKGISKMKVADTIKSTLMFYVKNIK